MHFTFVLPFLFCLIYYLIILNIIVFISKYYLQIRVIHKICNNNTIHQHKQQQRKCAIDTMIVLHCTNFLLLKSIYLTANLLFQYFITVVLFDFTRIHLYLYLFSYLFKYWNLQVKLEYYYLIDCGNAILLRWFWAHLVMDQWIKQTLCVRYFTGFI